MTCEGRRGLNTSHPNILMNLRHLSEAWACWV